MKKLLLTVAALASFGAMAKIGTGMRYDTGNYGCSSCNGGYRTYNDGGTEVLYGPDVVLVENGDITGLGLVSARAL